MPLWLESLWAVSQWLLLGAIALALMPIERYFPRIRNQAKRKGRLPAIVAMGIGAIAVSWVTHVILQPDLVAFFYSLNVIRISRLDLHPVIIFVIGFLFLDFLGYVLHVASHKVDVLWRLHSIHHSDEHVTSVSGFLHHPLSVLLSAVYLLCLAAVFGIPVLVFVMFGLVSTIHVALSHADVALPKWLDRILRWIFVTPDVHRTHHSIEMREGNSNFGVIFSFWDRLFRTYTDRPATGEELLVMGLPESEKPRAFTPAALLLHPFVWRKQR